MNLSEFEDAYDDDERVRTKVDDVEGVRKASLDTPVCEIMARDPLVVDVSATVVAAVDAMNMHHTGCVLVEEAGKLVGIFTERDVLRKVAFHEGNRNRRVGSAMTRDPETLPPSASIAYALNKMSVDGYRHIPIVADDGKAIGVVSVKDIVHFVVEWFPESVLNLPSDPEKVHHRTEDGG